MRHLAALILLLFTTTLAAQKALHYPNAEKEYFIRVLPYGDGSFSVYSAPYTMHGPAVKGMLRTYGPDGELTDEQEVTDELQLGSNPRSLEKEGLEPINARHLFNRNDRLTIAVGASSKHDFYCRILNAAGETRQIVIPKAALDNAWYRMVGYGLDDRGDVNVVLLGRSRILQVRFRVDDFTYELKELTHPAADLKAWTFVGQQRSSLVFLVDDRKQDGKANLLRIDNGVIRTEPVRLPDGVMHSTHAIVEEVPQLGTGIADLYFSVRKWQTPDFTMYRLSENRPVETMQWRIPWELIRIQELHFGDTIEQDPARLNFPRLCIYSTSGGTDLIYSYNGWNASWFPLYWEQKEIGAFDSWRFVSRLDWYFNDGKITTTDPMDLVPFVEQSQNALVVRKLLDDCRNQAPDCLLTVHTILREDGTYGFLVVDAEGSGQPYYQNVRILKY
jgi:hypothetical protein